MSIYRLVCAAGPVGLVWFLRRLPVPRYFLADEKHSHCLSEKVYLPTVAEDRLVWHLGYTQDKSAEAFEASYGEVKEAALAVDDSYQARGILTDGFESTIQSLQVLFPEAALGNCLLHAAKRVPTKLKSVSSSVRQSLSHRFYTLFEHAQQRKGLRVFSLGQKLRRFAEKVTKIAGEANGEKIRQWIQNKKAGWYRLLEDPHMPTTTTYLDQAHNVIDRKLFMMKGFHHPQGSQKEFLNGLAVLYNLMPYQRRAKHAGQCGIEVQGGKLPTKDWFLNLRILTAGGFAMT